LHCEPDGATDEFVATELEDEFGAELLLTELLTGAAELAEETLPAVLHTLPVIAGRSVELLFFATWIPNSTLSPG